MLRFISFGSGSSGNCYYLYTETDSLIIDAGVGIRSLKKYFRDYGLDIYKVHRILITHDHADHIKCVGSLSHDYQLPVFATRTVHEGIDRNFCVVRKVGAELRHYVEPGVTVQLGEFAVTPFTVPHDSSDNVGYMIEVHSLVFDDGICDAKHHIGVVCPVANLPSLAVPVLEDVAVMQDANGIFPRHILIGHPLCAQAQCVTDGLAVYSAF